MLKIYYCFYNNSSMVRGIYIHPCISKEIYLFHQIQKAISIQSHKKNAFLFICDNLVFLTSHNKTNNVKYPSRERKKETRLSTSYMPY